jgi:NAD(P)-dependent dehydrogenase (short-subunit alcohol dehydrogenase family)
MNRKRALGLGIAVGAGVSLVARALRSARAVSFADKTVLIFGGSRGLGLVLARELAAEGAIVILAARQLDELERARDELTASGARVTIIPCDVTDRAQVGAAIERVIEDHGALDVLINDAGIIQVGPIEHMALADFEEAMATHFWGPLATTLAALPHMRQGGAKRIVNISSIGGKIAVPHLVPYSASKFALTGLSEGLRAELAREGISVTTVCPGLMRTGSTYNAWFKGQHQREFAWFHIADAIPGISIDAGRAARQIIDACRHGDAELVITPVARLAALLNATCPGTMAKAMAVANRLLPSPAEHGGNEAQSGWQSTSRFVPSTFTTLADRASLANNEVPLVASGDG